MKKLFTLLRSKKIIIVLAVLIFNINFIFAQLPNQPCSSCGSCAIQTYVSGLPGGYPDGWYYGDANRDGMFDITDITRIMTYVNNVGTGPLPVTGCYDDYDIDGDGDIDLDDATCLNLFIYSGAPNPIPVSGQICNQMATTPGNPTGTTPACDSTLLSRTVPQPINITWYWQGITCDTITIDSTATYNATISGINNYYLRARHNISTCWSSCSNIQIEIVTPPVAPTSASSNPPAFCLGTSGTIDLSIIGGAGDTVRWFTGSCGGTAIGTGSPLTIPKPTSTIIYYARWENLCGNSTCVSVTVTVNSLPTADAGLNDTICDGDTSTLVAIGGIDYEWSTIETTASITVSPSIGSNTYTVTVTDGNGCTDTDEVIVLVNSLPTADAGLNDTLCAGDTTILTATGGGTYEWSTLETTQSITVSPSIGSNTYTVTVTLSTGCTDTDEVIVLVNSLPTADAGLNDTLCDGDTSTLIATGGGDYEWNTTETTASITVLPPVGANTYTVTVTDVNGCIDTDEVIVLVNSLPIADAGLNDALCNGDTSTLLATGGIDYEWNTLEATASITASPPLGANTYTVTITDVNGCTDTDEVIVLVNSLPTADAGLNDTLCDGDTSVLIATGGGGYIWSSTETNSSITVNPNITTTYTVTVTLGTGCSDVDSLIVFVNPLPTANAGLDDTLCAGDTKILTATGGGDYEWNTAETTASITVSPSIGSNTYTVTVTDGNGCTDTDEVIVLVNSLPTADAGLNDTLCYGDTSILTAIGGGDYIWNTAETIASITVLPPVGVNIYTVTVTDINGCTDTNEVIVVVNPLLTANAGVDDTICENSSKLLMASGGNTYEWSTGQTAMFITVTPSVTTTYIVTVTNFYGCTDDDTVVVYVNPLPSADAGADVTICNRDTNTLIANGGISYEWSTTETIDTIQVNPIVTTTYIVTVTDTNFCSNTDTVIVTVNQLPPANAGTDISICDGSLGSLLATGGIIYKWSTDATTDTITINPSLNTTYTVTVTDASNCSNTDEVVVAINPLPNADAGLNDTICNGDTITLIASGGTSYNWSIGTTTSTITVNPSNTTTYIVTVLDINNCSDIDTVLVTVNPLPPANVGNDVAICDGDTATLIATGGGTYVWSNAGETTDTIEVAPFITTTYTITVTDTNNCSNTDEVVVTVNSLPTIPDVSDQALCTYDNQVTFNVNNPDISYQYHWYDTIGGPLLGVCNPSNCSSITISNITIPDQFYVRCEDANGCYSAYDTVYVTVAPMPIAAFSIDDVPPYYEGQQFQFRDESIDAYKWNWTFGDAGFSTDRNPIHAYSLEGIYLVTLIVCTQPTPTECCDTIIMVDYMHIVKKTDVYVPGAFTPNGDNENDELKVLGGNIIKLNFIIYNQWGIKVFESNAQDIGWDGTFQGNDQPEGNFVYLLEAHIADGREIKKQGVVLLIK